MSDSVNVRIPRSGVYNTTTEGGANLVAMAEGKTCRITLESDHRATIDITTDDRYPGALTYRVPPTSTILEYDGLKEYMLKLVRSAHKYRR